MAEQGLSKFTLKMYIGFAGVAGKHNSQQRDKSGINAQITEKGFTTQRRNPLKFPVEAKFKQVLSETGVAYVLE
ncbi:MAG: hypothetical protein LBN33_07685 [Desulfovibrio sp.]|nr:hypothetical protein [Desulfovibrio sp.]